MASLSADRTCVRAKVSCPLGRQPTHLAPQRPTEARARRAQTCFDRRSPGKTPPTADAGRNRVHPSSRRRASAAWSTVRQSELNELTETHEFDVFELDLLYRELETRAVEIVDDTKEVEKAPPPPPPPAPTVESTTDALQLFL